jgi:hypothetical protein
VSEAPTVLEQISTRWHLISDPAQFVLRYAPAIRRYLGALLRDPDAVDEVGQELLLRSLQSKFSPERVTRGRFRDYLRSVVRNAALTWWRRQQSRPAAVDLDPDELAGASGVAELERGWVDEWRRCLLERTWEALDAHQREASGNLAYTTLRVAVDHPDESPAQAARVSALAGRELKPEAFRKQLSRARRLFAALLVREVAQTLERPTADDLAEELAEVGLLADVEPFLPADRREWLSLE